MKKKRLIKKLLAVVLSCFALFSASTIAPFAGAVFVPNIATNAYDEYNIEATSNYTVTGYMTMAVSDDLQFSSVTVAGKTNSITRAVAISCAAGSSYSKYISMQTTKNNGDPIKSLSYSGTGAIDGNSNYMDKKAVCLYYILVVANTRATSATNSYYATPSITSQI